MDRDLRGALLAILGVIAMVVSVAAYDVHTTNVRAEACIRAGSTWANGYCVQRCVP